MSKMAKSSIWIDGHQAGDTLKNLQEHVRKLQNELKRLPVASDDYKEKLKELQKETKVLENHQQQVKGVSASYGKASGGISGMLKQFAPAAGVIGLATMAIQGVSAAVTSWYNNNKEMEKSLSSLKSLTGASAEDIAFYKEQAQEMGKTTSISAMQAVDAFKLIGSARPDLLKNKEALAQVTRETVTLAEAAEMDLGEAAQSLAGTMNQFNLGAESSKRIINALAAGSKEGAAEINEVSQSMDKFGSVAAANNVTVEESVALVELLSEKNIKGSEAGTQLRNVLLNVATASALPDEAQKAMEQYGVNLEIVQNKALPLEQRLREMAKVQGDQNALVKIFGKENVVAGQTVLKNVDHFSKLTAAVTGTNTAYEQAAINNDNLDGDLKKLGSAWEGLTLSMDGGSSIFREVVQAGSGVLNWATDTIAAFKEADGVKLETSMLKLGKALTYINPITWALGDAFRDMIDEQIRFNELTSSVLDGMKEEADSSTVLTEALKQNNAALKSKNLSDEQAARINEENQQIIGQLNERYPELTKNMDLNKATGSELSKLQKDINKNLLQQSIAAVQAAESERILSEIVKNSMAISEQRAKESKRWAVTNFIADIFADDAADMQENQEKLKKQLMELPKTMQDVAKQIEDINPQFGVAYKENAYMIQDAWRELYKIKQKMKDAEGAELQALQANEKAMRLQIGAYNKKNNELKKAAIEGKKSQEEEAAAATENAKAQEAATKKAEEANKKAQERYKKLKDTLDDLIKSTEKFRNEFDYKEKLDAFTDEQQKELFALEHSIDEKYKKEIDSATELAKQKGSIGIKAQEQLNALIAIKEEELAHERLKINEKYQKEKDAADREHQQANYELFKMWTEREEKALMDLKVARATAAAKEVADNDIEAQRKANEELRKVLIEQIDFEYKAKLEALKKESIEQDLSAKEVNARKEQLEIEHRTKVEEINKTSDEKILADSMARMSTMLDSISQVVDTLSSFLDAEYEHRIGQINKQQKTEVKAIEDKYRKGLISKEEYEAQIATIEADAESKRRQIENEKAKKDKEVAIAQAIIQGALSVLKASPNPAAMILAGLAATAQIAIISATEVPQYAEGGYHNVIGAKDGKMYQAKNIGRHPGGMLPGSPSLVLTSEHGPEYFVPNHLLQDQRVLNSVRVIEAIRTNQFADGGFSGSGAVGSMGDPQLMALLQANYSMLVALNQQIPNMGVKIGDQQIIDINTRSQEINDFIN